MANGDAMDKRVGASALSGALEAIRKRVRFIGGGTCAGKTTLARSLATAYSIPLFSVDDRLWDYSALAERAGSTVANNVTETDFERFWMRNPEQQFKEMWQFYHDVFPFVLADLADMVLADSADEPIESGGRANPSGLDASGSDLFSEIGWIDSSGLRGETPVLIAEGIAFLPSLLHGIGIPPEHCVFLTAETGVHTERYAKRDWAHLMLEGCNDKVRAFDLWMQRDELFAAAVRAECAELGYSHVFVQ